MQKIKRNLALMLAILMCLCVLPTDVYAAGEEVQSDTSIIDENLYGSQLSEVEKEIYQQLKEHYLAEDGFSNGNTEKATFTISQTFQAATPDDFSAIFNEEISPLVFKAAKALVMDYPQLYWSNKMSAGCRMYQDSDGMINLYDLNFTFAEPYDDFSMIDTYETKVREVAQDIYESVGSSATEYDYYKAIHDWICNKVTYNYDAIADGADEETYAYVYSSGTVFTEEEQASVVCEGYAESFKVLCDQIRTEYGVEGLYATLVSGYGMDMVSETGGEHMWNYVLMSDNKWYAVDVTWDDQETATYYDYFLCGTNSEVFNGALFGQDHIEDTEFDYKDIAEKAYDPSAAVNPTDIAADINGVKLSLSDKIGIKFLVETDDTLVDDDDYMKVTVGDGTPYTIPVSAALTDAAAGDAKVFECKVNSKQMTEQVTVQMFVDGVAGTPVTYSVKEYADAVLASETYVSSHDMVKAMLNYGGYAQVWFDKATTGLANEGLYNSATDPVLNGTVNTSLYAHAVNKTIEDSGLNLVGATLLLESEVEIRIYFSLDSGKTVHDYQIQCETAGFKTGYSEAQGAYYVAIPGIGPAGLQKMHTVKFQNADGEDIISISYGALSYANTVINANEDINLQNLAKALFWYNKAAIDYNSAN